MLINLRSRLVVITLLAALLLVVFLTGCSGGSSSSSTTPPVVPARSANLLGMHVQAVSTPWPTIGFGEVRVWSNISSARWATIDQGNGVYDFRTLDYFLQEFYANGIGDVVYTIGQVPEYASSNPNDTTCDFAVSPGNLGGCDLPNDINSDGSGTNQTYINFVTAIAQHVNDPTFLQTHAHIQYWEPWNEWYRNKVVNGDNAFPLYSVNASYAQIVRMTEDVRCVITGTGSVNGSPCTATPIDPTAKIVSPSDGGNCCGSEAVFQNFLYCNGTGPNAPLSPCTTGSRGSAAVDVINSHFYEPDPSTPEDLPGDVALYTSVLSATDQTKPMWSDEGGWGKDDIVSDPDIQASWVARYYLMGWSAGLSRLYWFAYDNPNSGTLWTPTGGLTLAGKAYGIAYNWIVGSKLGVPCSVNGTIWTCNLTLSNGNVAEAIWDTSQNCSNGNCTTTPQSVSTSWTNYQDLTGSNHDITSSGSVPVGIKPILLTPSAAAAP